MKIAITKTTKRNRVSKGLLAWIEFKKFFMPKRVGLTALVLLCGGLWLYPFPVLHMGEEFKDWETTIAIKMEADYGLQIDTAEFEQFKQSLIPKIAEADAYIRSEPAFAKANLDSYERYVKRSEMTNGGTMGLDQRIRSGSSKDLFDELKTSQYLIDRYEDHGGGFYTFGMNEAELNRVAVVESREGISLLPSRLLSDYSSNILYRVAMTVMLVTALLVMHIHIGDRRTGLGELQATSLSGAKGLFYAKMIAALALSTGVTVVLLVIVLLAYRFSGLWSLIEADISGQLSGLFWYDLSFLQYVFVTFTAVLILGWIAALFTLACSMIASNYRVLIGAMVIILFFFFKGDFLLNRLLNYMLGVGGGYSPFYVWFFLGLLLVMSLISVYAARKVERWRVQW